MGRARKGSGVVIGGHVYVRVPTTQERITRRAAGCATKEEGDKRAAFLFDLVEQLRRRDLEAHARRIIELGAEATTEAELRMLTKIVQDIAAGGAVVDVTEDVMHGVDTFQALGELWTEGKLATRYRDHVRVKSSSDVDAYRLGKYVYKNVGNVLLRNFELSHYELVMRKLPGHLKSSSRRHVAQVMRRILQLAQYPCKLIPLNPVPQNALPKKQRRDRAFQYLYPDEDAQLLKCKLVPFESRLLYGFLTRMGFRLSEIIGTKGGRKARERDGIASTDPLVWRRVDLDRGVVLLDRNKTGDPRPILLDAGTREALALYRERWRAQDPPSGLVFLNEQQRPFGKDRLPAQLRADLKVAGVWRAELHENSDVRRHVEVHDLRATFITVSLAVGKSETWVRDRSGHRSTEQLDQYRRPARMFAELELGDFVPLHRAIPEFAELVGNVVSIGRASKAGR